MIITVKNGKSLSRHYQGATK